MTIPKTRYRFADLAVWAFVMLVASGLMACRPNPKQMEPDLPGNVNLDGPVRFVPETTPDDAFDLAPPHARVIRDIANRLVHRPLLPNVRKMNYIPGVDHGAFEVDGIKFKWGANALHIKSGGAAYLTSDSRLEKAYKLAIEAGGSPDISRQITKEKWVAILQTIGEEPSYNF